MTVHTCQRSELLDGSSITARQGQGQHNLQQPCQVGLGFLEASALGHLR